MTEQEKQKYRDNANRYRNNRLAKGWLCFYRIIPQDLADELDRIVARHKAEHYDVWKKPKLK